MRKYLLASLVIIILLFPAVSQASVTNQTSSSFAVSWTTNRPTIGCLVGRRPFLLLCDDNLLSTTHLIRAASLEAEKFYSIWIMNGLLPQKLVVQTLPLRSGPPSVPHPVYGIIYAADGAESKPAAGVLVYLTANGAVNTLTTRTDDNGNYSFDLGNLLDADYQTPSLPQDEGAVLKLRFLGGKLGQTYLEVDSAVASPVPPVTLSKLRKPEFNNDFSKVLGAASRLIAKIADEDKPVKKKTTAAPTQKESPAIKQEIQNVQQHIVSPSIQSSPPSSPPSQSAPAPTSAPAPPPPSQPRPDQGVDNTPPPPPQQSAPPAPVTCARRVLMTQCNSCGTGAELILTESCGETWGLVGSLASCKNAALCGSPTPAAVEPSPTKPAQPTAPPPPATPKENDSQKPKPDQGVDNIPPVFQSTPVPVSVEPSPNLGTKCWNGNLAPDGDLANCPLRPTVRPSPPGDNIPTTAITPQPTSAFTREVLPPEEKGGGKTGSKTCDGGFVEGQSWQSECRGANRIKYLCANGSINELTVIDPSCPGYYQQHIVPQDANLETACSANQRSVVSKKNPMLEIEECLAGTTCTGGKCTVYQPPPTPTQSFSESFSEALVSFFSPEPSPEPTKPILPKPTEVIQPPTERKIDRECLFTGDCPGNQTCVGFKCVSVELRPTSAPVSPTSSPTQSPKQCGGYLSGQSWQLNCKGTKREVATCSDGKVLTSMAPDTSCSGMAEETDIPFMAPTISPPAGGGLTSGCEEETSPLLCGGSTKQLQCWFTARDQRGKCAAGLFCSGKCQETEEIKPSPTPIPTPTPAPPILTPIPTPYCHPAVIADCEANNSLCVENLTGGYCKRNDISTGTPHNAAPAESALSLPLAPPCSKHGGTCFSNLEGRDFNKVCPPSFSRRSDLLCGRSTQICCMLLPGVPPLTLTPPILTPIPTPSVPSTYTAYSCTAKGGNCYFGASSCASSLRRNSVIGNCPQSAICCGAPIEHDYCDRGETYCVNPTTVRVCKPDRTGYNTDVCDAGTSCDDKKGYCVSPTNVPPPSSGAITYVGEGYACDKPSFQCKNGLGLHCFNGTCKKGIMWKLAVIDNITHEKKCILAEDGEFPTYARCMQGYFIDIGLAAGGLRLTQGTPWVWDSTSQRCIRPTTGLGYYETFEECNSYNTETLLAYIIDEKLKKCVPVTDGFKGEFVLKDICEAELIKRFPYSPTDLPKQQEVSLDDYGFIKRAVGKECGGNIESPVFDGKVGEKNYCTISCQWDDRSKKFKLQENCFSPNYQAEKFCQDDQVVRKNNQGEIQILEMCSPPPLCGLETKENKACPVFSCRDGQCAQGSGNICSTPGEIKPSEENRSLYLVCDNQSRQWKPLADSQPIRFADSCPNSYREGYLETIALVQDFIFPDGGLTINCKGNVPVGGSAGNNNPYVPLNLYCDPTLYRTDCAATLVHELAHTWQARQEHEKGSSEFFNENFNEEIGCREASQEDKVGGLGVYRYTKEIAVDDDKYGPFVKWNGEVGISKLNCAEAFALANNHYVYNGCYQKEKYPIQYNWVKENIYNGKEFCDK